MISFELTYQNGKKKKPAKARLSLYTSWDELNLSHYERISKACEIENRLEKMREFIRILSVGDEGLHLVYQFNEDVLNSVDGIIYFINDVNGIAIPALKLNKDISVDESPWSALNKCHDALTEHKGNIILAARDCIDAYTDVNPDKITFTECLAIFYDICSKIEAFHTKFAILHDQKPTTLQIRAGISVFENLKWFHTAKALADSGILNIATYEDKTKGQIIKRKYEAVLDMPAVTVYMWLVDDLLQANYNENYQKLQSAT